MHATSWMANEKQTDRNVTLSGHATFSCIVEPALFYMAGKYPSEQNAKSPSRFIQAQSKPF